MKTDQDYRDEYNRREVEARISRGMAPRLRGREIGIPAPADEPMIAVYEPFQPPSNVWRWTCAVVVLGVMGIIIGYCSRVQ